MLNSIYFVLIGCLVLSIVYFVLAFILSGEKRGEKARKASKVILIQGILMLLVFIGCSIALLFFPDILKSEVTKINSMSKAKASETTVTGLTGSNGNGSTGGGEYPEEPKVADILIKGDQLLGEDKIQEAIDVYKLGLGDKTIESYSDIFDRRISQATDLKYDYMNYQRGLEYFNKGNYERAYEEFKYVKPSERLFYADIEKKMETIKLGIAGVGQAAGVESTSTGTAENATSGAGGNPAATSTTSKSTSTTTNASGTTTNSRTTTTAQGVNH